MLIIVIMSHPRDIETTGIIAIVTSDNFQDTIMPTTIPPTNWVTDKISSPNLSPIASTIASTSSRIWLWTFPAETLSPQAISCRKTAARYASLILVCCRIAETFMRPPAMNAATKDTRPRTTNQTPICLTPRTPPSANWSSIFPINIAKIGMYAPLIMLKRMPRLV